MLFDTKFMNFKCLHMRLATERRENNLKRFEDLHLEAKARFWHYTCRIRSAAGNEERLEQGGEPGSRVSAHPAQCSTRSETPYHVLLTHLKVHLRAQHVLRKSDHALLT